VSATLDTRRWVALHLPGARHRAPSLGRPVHPDESHRPLRCSIFGLPLERAGPDIPAGELAERSTRVALSVGFVTAVALAAFALVAFPPYRGDVLSVLPWILVAVPLFRLLARNGPRRGTARTSESQRPNRRD
jgi:hypothetical protein